MRKFFTLVLLSIFLGAVAQKNAVNRNYFVDYHKALGLLEKDKFEDAQDLLEDIPEQDSLYPKALYQLLLLSYNRENYPKVEELGQRLSKIPFLEGHMACNLWALSLSNMDKHAEALQVVKKGLSIYTHSHLLHYRHALVLQDLNQHQEALKALQEAIFCYPLHAYSHVKLGEMAAHEGRYTQAIMSMTFATLLDLPEHVKTAVHMTLEKIASTSFEAEPKNLAFDAGDDYADIDRIIKSRVALSSKFKLKTKLKNVLYVRQLQVICETVKYKKDTDGFWMQQYVPLFQDSYQAKMFDGMTYMSLSGPDYGPLNAAVKKNRKRMDAYAAWFGQNSDRYLTRQFIEFQGKKQEVYVELGSKNIISRGLKNAQGKQDGIWFLYSEVNGRPIGTASFKDDIKSGEWVLDDEITGSPSMRVNFAGDAFFGPFITYYPDGKVQQNAQMKMGKPDGPRITFFPSQDTSRVENFVRGVQQGKQIYFYPDNSIKFIGNLVQEKWEGELVNFHPGGQMKSKTQFTNDVENGPFTLYHPNGKVYQQGIYKAGLLNDDFESYHDNGQLESKGRFKNDVMVGKWIYYYYDGKLKEELEFDEKGKENATQKSYDKDGKLFSEMEYKNGELQAYKFFDKQGKIIDQAQRSGKNMNYKYYNPRGVLITEGLLVKDEKSGLWRYYNDHGILIREQRYEQGKVTGKSTSYYPSGKVKTEENYVNDNMHGLYLEYFENGILKMEGYLRAGKQNGMWYYYYPDGSRSEKRYYEDDAIVNWDENYGVNGLVFTKSFHENDDISKVVYFDLTGKPIDTVSTYHGEITIPNPNGKTYLAKNNFMNDVRHGISQSFYLGERISATSTYSNGELQGLMKNYYENGQISNITKYVNGKRDSVATSYRMNGNVASRTNFRNGLREGLTEEFHPDGSLHFRVNYSGDELEGEVKKFLPNGDLYAVFYFDKGILVGYSYSNDKGGLVPKININTDANIVCYFKNGKKSFAGVLKNGVWHGDYQVFNAKGEIVEFAQYDYGTQIGDYKFNFSAEQPYFFVSYNCGMRHGQMKVYHLNGKLFTSSSYVWGVKHGEEQEYDKNGKLVVVRQYYNDVLIGEEMK